MESMKISVSLPSEVVVFLDEYAQAHGVASRSAVVQRAVGLLREDQLGEAYEQSWAAWEGSGEAAVWAAVTADGLVGSADAPR